MPGSVGWGAMNRLSARRCCVPLLLFCAMESRAQVAEPLTDSQRHVKTAGSIVRVGIPLGALALTWMLEPGDGRAAGGEAGSSLLLMGGTPRHDLLLALGRTWVITTGLKYAVNETRPNGGPRSFPSGHTSIAFSGAEFIRKEYGWKWAAPAYAAAGFVGWSRVESKQHYVHDVLAGAALGILANHDFWLRKEPDSAWRLSAAVFGSARAPVPGIRIQWSR